MCDTHNGMMLTPHPPPQKKKMFKQKALLANLAKLLTSARNGRKGFQTRKLLHRGMM